jgi:hypothetical protein
MLYQNDIWIQNIYDLIKTQSADDISSGSAFI